MKSAWWKSAAMTGPLGRQDPMSMGALTGNLITSSRVVAGRPVDDA